MRSVSNHMKFIRTYVGLCAVFSVTLPIAAQQEEIIGGRRAVANEVLVKFRDSATARLRTALVREHNVRFSRGLGSSGVVQMRSATESAASMIQRLSMEPDVLYVEPDYMVYAVDALPSTGPNDALFPEQWDMQNAGQSGGLPHADIDAVPAWAITTGSRATVVGVVDTGIDYTHPDLAPNVWSAPSSFTVTFGPGDSITCPAGSHGYDAIRNVCDPMDQYNHGTHVSGTIGAAGNNRAGIAGINWTASILGLRFMDGSGNGTVANAIRAIDFAIQLRSVLPAANVRVLSNSWEASGPSQSLLDAINAANSAGILFVVAAGNEGRNLDATPTYPASYRAPNVISVAATDSKDALASFSNYGAQSVDLGAPGVGILSTVIGGQYAFWDGTSMAAPHVSGAAALVLSVCPQPVAALRQTILNNVDPDPALAGKTVTGGRLNIYRVVRSCAQTGFTVSATPAALAVAPGSSVTSVVSVSSATSVTLAASGLLQGVTAVFNPPVASSVAPALLIVTASATAPLNAATVTITGSGAGISNSARVTLTVAAARGFTLSATPAAVSVAVGSSSATMIGVVAKGGFKDNVALSATGLPAGVTASFAPAFMVPGGSSTLTLTASSTAAPASKSITVTGASGNLSATAFVNVAVVAAPDFRISAAPAAMTVTAGRSATAAITISGSGSFKGSATLTATGLPSGVTATFTPTTVLSGGTATLTLTAAASAPSTTHSVAIAGASGAVVRTTGLAVTVVAAAPVVKLSVSAAWLTLAAGSWATSKIGVTGSGGFTGTVALSVAGLPPGVTAVFSPAAVAAGGIATLTMTASPSVASYTTLLTITGASGAAMAKAGLTLNLVAAPAAPAFKVSASPNALTVMTGSSATSTVSITPLGAGFTGTVALAATGLPSGVTAVFKPASASAGGTATLTLSAAALSPPVTTMIAITGTNGTRSSTVTLQLSMLAAHR